VAMMQAFDAPVMQTNCESRRSSTVATQSLMLMNGRFSLTQATRLAERAQREAIPLKDSAKTDLPDLPAMPASEWRYGFGKVNDDATRMIQFTEFPHWTGSQWQASQEFPDPEFGYVFLNATSGHPDLDGLAVIRRWTAPYDAQVTVTGTAHHPSPHGNGVRCRVISDRSGRMGEWIVSHDEVATAVGQFSVTQGETIDFVTDSNGPHTSDSFSWPVTLTVESPENGIRSIASAKAFHGPMPSHEELPSQIHRAWQLALCRKPTPRELSLAVEFAAEQITTLQQSDQELPDGRSTGQQALISICQALLSSNEFLYVD